MLTKEHQGSRVQHKAFGIRGEIVAVREYDLADIRWDYGPRWNCQKLGKDFDIIKQEAAS